jgi:hypothetical protein
VHPPELDVSGDGDDVDATQVLLAESHRFPGAQSDVEAHCTRHVPAAPQMYGRHDVGEPPSAGVDESPSAEHFAVFATHVPPSHRCASAQSVSLVHDDRHPLLPHAYGAHELAAFATHAPAPLHVGAATNESPLQLDAPHVTSTPLTKPTHDVTWPATPSH